MDGDQKRVVEKGRRNGRGKINDKKSIMGRGKVEGRNGVQEEG